jgi:hypothetical protein
MSVNFCKLLPDYMAQTTHKTVNFTLPSREPEISPTFINFNYNKFPSTVLKQYYDFL